MSPRKPKPHSWQFYADSLNKGVLFSVLLFGLVDCFCMQPSHDASTSMTFFEVHVKIESSLSEAFKNGRNIVGYLRHNVIKDQPPLTLHLCCNKLTKCGPVWQGFAVCIPHVVRVLGRKKTHTHKVRKVCFCLDILTECILLMLRFNLFLVLNHSLSILFLSLF